MSFFLLLAILTGLAAVIPGTRTGPARMRLAMEIAGGIGLLLPELRRLAGAMLALYFVAVFPANLHNALNGLAVEGLPQAQWYYWVRLAFQPCAVWWALYCAQLIGWPFAGRTRLEVHP